MINSKFSVTLIIMILLSASLISESIEGLQAHYCFEGNANDISGNSNHGIEYGDINYSAGVDGNAKLFNNTGDNDYIIAPNTLGQEYTLSLWTNLTSVGAHNSLVMLNSTINWGDSDFWLFTSHNRIAVIQDGNDLRYNAYNTAFLNSPVLADNTTYSITVTYSNQLLKVYVAGTLYTQYDNVSSISGSSSNIKIGATTDNRYQTSGIIDELKIYNQVINDSQALSLASIPEVSTIFFLLIGSFIILLKFNRTA